MTGERVRQGIEHLLEAGALGHRPHSFVSSAMADQQRWRLPFPVPLYFMGEIRGPQGLRMEPHQTQGRAVVTSGGSCLESLAWDYLHLASLLFTEIS